MDEGGFTIDDGESDSSEYGEDVDAIMTQFKDFIGDIRPGDFLKDDSENP